MSDIFAVVGELEIGAHRCQREQQQQQQQQQQVTLLHPCVLRNR